MRFIAAVVTLVAVGSTGAFAAPVIVTDPSVHVRVDPSSLSVRSVLHTHALNARTYVLLVEPFVTCSNTDRTSYLQKRAAWSDR